MVSEHIYYEYKSKMCSDTIIDKWVGLALAVQRIGYPPFFEHLFCKVPV